MAAIYFLIYRIYFVASQHRWMRFVFRKFPKAAPAAKQVVRDALLRFASRERRFAVRVQSGLSRGLWMRVRLPEEISYWRGQREHQAQDAIAAAVRPSSVVYDIGAHVGSVTLGVARLVGEKGRVVAFDGDPDNAASLRESCQLNHLERRVRVMHAAVWSHSSDQGILFKRGAKRLSHGGVETAEYHPVLADGPTIQVPCITLDDFVASERNHPELIKIDVEGAEYEVLRGGENLFSHQRPLIIVEVHDIRALDQINGWLQTFQYGAKWDIPAQGFPRILLGWPAESLSSPFESQLSRDVTPNTPLISSNPIHCASVMPVSSPPPPPYFDKMIDAWIFSRYADVASAMREAGLLPAGAASGSSKALDPQQHLKMREETSHELTPVRLASWQRVMEAKACELVVKLAAGSTVDLLEDYGRPFCLAAAVMVSGANPGDVDRLTALARMASESAAAPNDAAAKIRGKRASAEMRRSFPPGPSSLRGAGFVAMSQTLLSLLANMWLALASHPEEFSRLHKAGVHTPAVDELLRYAGVPKILHRVAEHDMHLCDTDIREGHRVILKLSAAHRDAEVYPNPERLDLDRRGPPPLCLGTGGHSCVGAGLIRTLTTVATGAITERFESIRLAETVEWEGGEGFRTPKTLRVKLS